MGVITAAPAGIALTSAVAAAIATTVAASPSRRVPLLISTSVVVPQPGGLPVAYADRKTNSWEAIGATSLERLDVQPIATIRSIGTRARSAMAGSTRTSWRMSRSESRSFGSVIIFMYLQKAIRFASIRFACGAAICSG